MAITIIVTNAGRAALVNAANNGTNAVTITQLGITAAVFVPNVAQVALPGEIKRIASVAGIVVDDDKIHVTASDVTNTAYSMRGFGLYLADGTLFAIYGQAGEILNKTSESMMLLALDIGFVDVDAEMIVFGDTNFILPPATTEILGLVELATTAEGQAGSDATRVLTPLVGKQSALGWLLSQDGSGSGLDADLLDGMHASSFATAGHTHGTMAEQNANAVAITGGAINGTPIGATAPASGRFSSVVTTGAVGIGAPAPVAPLHITTDAGKHLLFKSAAHDTLIDLTCALTFGRADGATDLAAVVGWNGGGVALIGRTGVAFATGGATNYSATVERMRIDASGKVGIGTSAPGARLDVSGTAPNIRVTTLDYDLPYGLEIGPTGLVDAAFKTKGNTGELNISSGRSAGWGGSIRLITDNVEVIRINSTGAAIFGNVAWHGGNDGSGSGLDADLLDGQHGAYYLPAASYTAADVLAKLLTVDGPATGLDADLLDGQHGAYYLPAASYSAADVRTKLLTVDGSGSAIDADLLDGQHGAYYLPAASYSAADVLAKLLTVDGSGTGIDADLLDGLHASDFVKYSDFTGSNQSKAQSGWQKLPGGMIIQWGRFTASSNNSSSVTLPLAFPSLACAAVVSGTSSTGADAKDNPPATYSLTNTTLTVFNADDSATSTHYIVMGF